jgi:hypothetical protein
MAVAGGSYSQRTMTEVPPWRDPPTPPPSDDRPTASPPFAAPPPPTPTPPGTPSSPWAAPYAAPPPPDAPPTSPGTFGAGGWYPPGPGGPGSAPAPVEPPKRSRKPLVVATVAGVAVALIAAAVAVVAVRHSGPSYPSQWDSRILPIVHFDEKERGMLFKHPVQVLFMTPKAFNKTVASSPDEETDSDRQDAKNQEAILRSMGLIDGKVDLYKQENGLDENGILAYYDFHDKKVRVKGTQLTPDVRVTLAHELTHALQDQYFDLGRQDTLPDDASLAYRSVIEGDAVVVQDAYAQTMSQADQDAYDKAESQGSDQAYSNVPDILVAQDTEPYVIGPAFVGALKDRGGNSAIDDALHNPPASTAALMNLFTYLNQTSSTAPVLPALAMPAGAKRIDDGDNTFGALQWYLLLARRINVHNALAAVDGWRSDTTVSYRQTSGVSCIDAEYQGTSAAATKTMGALLRQWKAVGPSPDATVTDHGSTVELHSCDPGTSVKLTGTDRSSDSIEVIAARLELAGALSKDGVPDSVAACASTGTINRLTIDQIVSDSDADQAADQAAVTAAVQACH